MSIIDGHTCIGDDGGTPNRRCDACDREKTMATTHENAAYDACVPTAKDLKKVELAVKLALAGCPRCSSEKNSREEGGNVHCFHCGKCGYVECADTDLYPTGEIIT